MSLNATSPKEVTRKWCLFPQLWLPYKSDSRFKRQTPTAPVLSICALHPSHILPECQAAQRARPFLQVRNRLHLPFLGQTLVQHSYRFSVPDLIFSLPPDSIFQRIIPSARKPPPSAGSGVRSFVALAAQRGAADTRRAGPPYLRGSCQAEPDSTRPGAARGRQRRGPSGPEGAGSAGQRRSWGSHGPGGAAQDGGGCPAPPAPALLCTGLRPPTATPSGASAPRLPRVTSQPCRPLLTRHPARDVTPRSPFHAWRHGRAPPPRLSPALRSAVCLCNN